MMSQGKRRGRRPGFKLGSAVPTPPPVENEYGPSAFVSGEVISNPQNKTGPKFGPRLSNLEEEMDLFQEKIDGLGYEHKVLMAEISIIVTWIREKFGVQLINEDSQILKFLHLSDGIQDLSKSLAMPRPKGSKYKLEHEPEPSTMEYQPYEDDYENYDDQQEQYLDEDEDGKQFLTHGSARMMMAPNQPLVFDQDLEHDQMSGEDELEEQVDEGVDQADSQFEQNEDDFDEVDGNGEGGHNEQLDDQDQDTVGDEYETLGPPPLIRGFIPAPQAQEDNNNELNDDGGDGDEQPATDEMKEEEQEGHEEQNTNEPASRSRSREEQKQPSPNRSNSRTRTRIAKAPKRYRDEDQAPVQVQKNKVKPRLSQGPGFGTSTATSQIQIQQRKKISNMGMGPARPAIVARAVPNPQANQPKFFCPVQTCGKYFPTREQLTKHHQLHKSKPTSLTPTDIAKLTCEYCHKIFSSTWNLKTHYRTHTGEKPYPCNYCGQRFAYNQSRELHERHNHTLERPYVCNFCGKSFCASGELSSHLGRVHQRTVADNKEQLEEMVALGQDEYDGETMSPAAAAAAKGNMNVKRQRRNGPGGGQNDDYGSHFLCYD